MRAALLLTFLAAAPAAAAPVFHDDFTGYGGQTMLQAPDSLFQGVWRTTRGSVDYFADRQACGGFAACVDLGADGAFAGDLNLAPGRYRVTATFWSPVSDEKVTVRIGQLPATPPGLIAAGVAGVVVVTGEAEAPTSDSRPPISPDGIGVEAEDDGDADGARLVDVRVDAVVPLPAAAPLLLGALGALAALSRRR
jgi:hypothetical protein